MPEAGKPVVRKAELFLYQFLNQLRVDKDCPASLGSVHQPVISRMALLVCARRAPAWLIAAERESNENEFTCVFRTFSQSLPPLRRRVGRAVVDGRHPSGSGQLDEPGWRKLERA